jgi:hypothetical protein
LSLSQFRSANKKFSERAILEIQDANMETDEDQLPLRHFDDESFAKAIPYLSGLDEFLGRTLQQSGSSMTKEQAITARKIFGTALHTIQDFYSHTNWIYINPGIYPKLWDVNDASNTSLLADLSQTKPCEQHSLHTDNNYPPHSGNYTADGKAIPTSGYAEDLATATAPTDKCAHGFFGNGIHKDWPGRTDHEPARDAATIASLIYANKLINDPLNNPNNVCMFMTDESCSSIINVDATTGSTGTGTVTSNPAGIACITGSDNYCSQEFDTEPVTLTATADQGAYFTGWSGPDAGNCPVPAPNAQGGTCTLAMDGKEKNITATFGSCSQPPSYKDLLLTASPDSGLKIILNISCVPFGTRLPMEMTIKFIGPWGYTSGPSQGSVFVGDPDTDPDHFTGTLENLFIWVGGVSNPTDGFSWEVTATITLPDETKVTHTATAP